MTTRECGLRRRRIGGTEARFATTEGPEKVALQRKTEGLRRASMESRVQEASQAGTVQILHIPFGAREVSKRGLSVTPSGIESRCREAGMGNPLEQLSAKKMLTIWGLRVAGAAFQNPNRWKGGGKSTPDEYLALVNYVEATEGFHEARPLLKHLYVDGQPIETYRYQLPGETLWMAARRHGQLEPYGAGAHSRKLAKILRRSFVKTLETKCQEQPFFAPAVTVEANEAENAWAQRYFDQHGRWPNERRREA